MPKRNSPVAFDDAKWRAESDARTLMDAEKIKADPKRLAAAKECAKKMAEDAMAAVAEATAAGR